MPCLASVVGGVEPPGSSVPAKAVRSITAWVAIISCLLSERVCFQWYYFGLCSPAFPSYWLQLHTRDLQGKKNQNQNPKELVELESFPLCRLLGLSYSAIGRLLSVFSSSCDLRASTDIHTELNVSGSPCVNMYMGAIEKG